MLQLHLMKSPLQLPSAHPSPQFWNMGISKSRFLAILAWLALLSVNETHAQSTRTTGDLLYPRSGTASETTRTKRSQRCQVSTAALKQSMLNINLFPDRKIVAVRDRESRHANGDTVWVGRVLDETFSRVTL